MGALPTGRRAAAAVFLLLALAACPRGADDGDILPLRDIHIDILRPGAAIRVEGSGFVPGPVDLELSGTVAQPGAAPEPWSHVISATATSGEEIVGMVPAAATEALHTGRGRFRGALVVRFPPPATPGLPRLVGRRNGLSAPMTADVPASRAVRTTLETAADAFLARLGLETDVVDPRNPGGSTQVVVRARPADAPPPLDEIAPGDRVAAIDGIPVASRADLAPDPHAPYVTLSLLEQGTGRAYDVHVALRTPDAAAPVEEALAVFAVLAVLGLALAVHFAGFTDRLGRLLVFPIVGRTGRTAEGSGRARRPPPARSGRAGQVLAAAALAGLAVAPVALYRVGRTLPVLTLWAVAVGLLLVHRLAHTAGDLVRERAGPGAGLGRTLGALATAGAAALPLTASAALVLWNSAALSVGGAVAVQETAPPGWAALRDPAALLVACLALCRLGTGFAPGQPGWRTAADALAAGGACLLLAVTGFGGWNVGLLDDTVFAGLPVGAWALEAKTALLFGFVVWHGRRRWARGKDPRAPGLTWIAALPLCAASACLDVVVPVEWFAAVVRPATLGLAGALALAFWLGHRQRTGPAILEIRVDAG